MAYGSGVYIIDEEIEEPTVDDYGGGGEGRAGSDLPGPHNQLDKLIH